MHLAKPLTAQFPALPHEPPVFHSWTIALRFERNLHRTHTHPRYYPIPMQITLDIPEAFAAQLLAAGKEPAREALEALAVEGFGTRYLNESQVRRTLGFGTRMKVHAFLAAHGVPLNYTMENLEQDIQAANSLHAEWLSQTAQTK